jgi:very-short-patch-repair endonuclease
VERDPVRVVRLGGGQARAGEIMAFSGKRRLLEAVAAGRLVRTRRGVYTLPSLPDAMVVASAVGGVVSHTSAVELISIPQVARPDRVHVTVRRSVNPTPHPQATIHWTRRLDAEDVYEGVTTPLRTVLDCAGTMPFQEALAIADGALACSFVRAEDLLRAAVESRGPGRAARVRVSAAADRRADNPFESVLGAIVIQGGVGGFVPQVEIRLPHRLLYADLADVDRRVVLEADSFAHHGTRAAFARDCERYNDLVAAGWTVLRFPWEHVMLSPERVMWALVETCERVDRERLQVRRLRPVRPEVRTNSCDTPSRGPKSGSSS